MENVLSGAVVVALLVFFVILTGEKRKWFERIQVRGPSWAVKIVKCYDLCLPFWVAVPVAILMSIIVSDWIHIITPLAAVPLYRILRGVQDDNYTRR